MQLVEAKSLHSQQRSPATYSCSVGYHPETAMVKVKGSLHQVTLNGQVCEDIFEFQIHQTSH